MEWNKNPNPKKSGWYLCTVRDNNGNIFVLPLHRAEYPKGNFYWSDISYNLKVVACVRFPKPYTGV